MSDQNLKKQIQKYGIEWPRPYLYPKQREAFFCENRFSLCLASTKAGKTHAACVWILERTVIDGGINWWLAPTHAQAKMAFDRICKMVESYIGTLFQINYSNKSIKFIGGGILSFKTAEKLDYLYGEDVTNLVLDEASRTRPDTLKLIISVTTATSGKVRIIGNSADRQNWFIKKYYAAMNDHEWYVSKITCFDAVKAGVISQSVVDFARQELPEDDFNVLYLAEVSESAGNPFNQKFIDLCYHKEFDQSAAVVVMGIDFAKSVDYTVITGLSANGDVVYFKRFKDFPWTEQKDIILNAVEACKPRTVLVDSTGLGDPLLEQLQQYNKNLFSGFKFSKNSKQDLMMLLKTRIQRQEIAFSQEEIYNELCAFEYVIKKTYTSYEAITGYHDDCVMSLALACRALEDLKHDPWYDFDLGKYL